MIQQITKSSIKSDLVQICHKKLTESLKTANNKINDLYNFQIQENGNENYDNFKSEISLFLNELIEKIYLCNSVEKLLKSFKYNLMYIEGFSAFLDEDIFTLENEDGSEIYKTMEQTDFTEILTQLFRKNVLSQFKEQELKYIVNKENWNLKGIALATALQFLGSFLSLEFKKFVSIFKSDINQINKFLKEFVKEELLSEKEVNLLITKYYKDIKVYIKELEIWEEEEHLLLDEIYDEFKILSNEKEKISTQKNASDIISNYFRMKVLKIVLEQFNASVIDITPQNTEELIFNKLSAIEDLIAIGAAIDSKIDLIKNIKNEQ